MTDTPIDTILNFTSPFAKSSKKPKISIICLEARDFPKWIIKQKKHLQEQVKQQGFQAKPTQICPILNKDSVLDIVLIGLSTPTYYLDAAHIVTYIQKNYANKFINAHVFEITSTHEEEVVNKICLGWGLGCYKYDAYKQNNNASPCLIWPKNTNQNEVLATLESITILRHLVNTPAHDLGTDELADVAKKIAKKFKAKTKIIHDDDLLKKNFPMIYHVGKASPRRPQLVDIKWGSSKHPKITLVGKGIIYDTGGLNLKPGQYMRDMKKDMGGAAHVLGVAYMIMALKLPIQLRVLLPIAENSVHGNAYRPGDILPTRKGLNVEICNTDAEGRLVLADALTYACEDEPDLLIDFATLTGAARVAVGYDMPAYFATNEKYIDDLRHSSLESDDPCWPFPLWKGYESNINGDICDILNDGVGRAGHIEAALILKRFIEPKTNWIHLDCFAWEQNGKPGRPKGGADTGMRAIVDFIRQNFGN
jgi:leucyl aminopeptidase